MHIAPQCSQYRTQCSITSTASSEQVQLKLSKLFCLVLPIHRPGSSSTHLLTALIVRAIPRTSGDSGQLANPDRVPLSVRLVTWDQAAILNAAN
jgi:hypothetical protein